MADQRASPFNPEPWEYGTPLAGGLAHAPLLPLALVAVAGVGLAEALPAGLSGWIGVLAGTAFLAWAYHLLRRAEGVTWRWWIAFLCGACLLFSGHGLLHRPPPLAEVPRPPTEARLTLRLERLFTSPEHRKVGIAQVTASNRPQQSLVGQRVYFAVWWSQPEAPLPDTFIEARGRIRWLAHRPVRGFNQFLRSAGAVARFEDAEVLKLISPAPIHQRMAAALRERFDAGLRAGSANFRDAELAELWRAMLTGRKEGLDRERRDAFGAAGVLHLFAVSGLHIGLLTAALLWLGHRCALSPAARFAMALALSGAFIWMIGLPPSSVRAWLMVLTWAAARILYRRPCPVSALAASALLVLMVSPRQLFDVGFQFSYLVIAGILLYGVPLGTALRHWGASSSKGRLVRWVRTPLVWLGQAFCISFSAVLFGAPLAIHYFQRLSLVGIVVNLAMVPAAAVAVPLGMASGTAGLLGWHGLAADLNLAGYRWLAGMETLALSAARLPGAARDLEWPSESWVWVATGAMLLTASLLPPPRRANLWAWMLLPIGLATYLSLGNRLHG